jgi:hypothetical protein
VGELGAAHAGFGDAALHRLSLIIMMANRTNVSQCCSVYRLLPLRVPAAWVFLAPTKKSGFRWVHFLSLHTTALKSERCCVPMQPEALQRSHLRDRDGYRKRNNMQHKETELPNSLTAVRRAQDYESNPLTGLESRRVVDH